MVVLSVRHPGPNSSRVLYIVDKDLLAKLLVSFRLQQVNLQLNNKVSSPFRKQLSEPKK